MDTNAIAMRVTVPGSWTKPPFGQVKAAEFLGSAGGRRNRRILLFQQLPELSQAVARSSP